MFKSKNKGATVVVFRGPVGVGKSTLLKLLADALKSKGKRVYIINEPTVTDIFRPVLEVTLKDHDDINTATSFQLVVLGERMGHMNTLIGASDAKGLPFDYILMDRDWREDRIFMNTYGNNDHVYSALYEKFEDTIKERMRHAKLLTREIYVGSEFSIQLERFAKRENKSENDVREYIENVNRHYNDNSDWLINDKTLIIDNSTYLTNEIKELHINKIIKHIESIF